jgi:hypothetical protein
MIDLETLGTHPGCVVLSVGAVQFDLHTGEIGATFHAKMCVHRSRLAGFHVEAPTIEWWRKQSQEAITLAFDGREDVRVAMGSFVNWMKTHFPTGGAQVFGNSARFDLNILETALRRTGFRPPWNSYLEWDARTIFRFAPQLRAAMPFEGVKHDALADAIHQARVVSAIWAVCNRTPEPSRKRLPAPSVTKKLTRSRRSGSQAVTETRALQSASVISVAC